MGFGTLSLSTVVRFEATGFNGLPPSRSPRSLPHLSLSKPTWVVRTELNVQKKRRKKPDPPCVVCEGRLVVEVALATAPAALGPESIGISWASSS
ncbi:hypothetical protein RJT34_11135 [Clitoria ternatea]|uniref:Uncharacterized protein n=1 Tax=Clitoria ternatea TaxID=43366 RepID=A0AAN9JJY0_CLITE